MWRLLSKLAIFEYAFLIDTSSLPKASDILVYQHQVGDILGGDSVYTGAVGDIRQQPDNVPPAEAICLS
jgi:hypothetical protein